MEKTDEGLIVKEVIAQNIIVGVFNEVLGEEEYIIQYDDIEVESEKKEISEIKNIRDNSYIKIWYIPNLYNINYTSYCKDLRRKKSFKEKSPPYFVGAIYHLKK